MLKQCPVWGSLKYQQLLQGATFVCRPRCASNQHHFAVHAWYIKVLAVTKVISVVLRRFILRQELHLPRAHEVVC